MKKTKLVSCLLLGALSAFAAKDCHYHHNLTEEYKQEFQTELSTYSEKIKKRKFPKNSETEDTINLTLYIDAEFKRNHDSWLTEEDNDEWKEALENSLEKAAKRFYEEFNINFQVDEAKYWDPEIKKEKPLHNLLEQLFKKESDTIGAIGLTGKQTYYTPVVGVAETLYTPKIKLGTAIREIRKSFLNPENLIYSNIPLENIIQHEMSHWFGAHDMIGIEESVMDYNYIDETNKWDYRNKTRIDQHIPEILEASEAYKNLKTKP